MNDLWTMVWKEWRDTFFPQGRLANVGSLMFIALLGVVFPLIDRQGWLTLSAPMVLLNIFFPYYYILVYIGDSFAGERERHTLETLLASRISDRAILWGKVLSTVGYIWGMTLFASLLSMVVVNLAQGGAWMYYSPISQWLGVLILSLLACLFSASGGILVSLHSQTARQAAQTFSLGSLGLFMAVYLILRALPPRLFAGLSGSQILLMVILFLAVLDSVLLAITMVSFRRSHLILS
jgi:ABC-2 type transport system permease protein